MCGICGAAGHLTADCREKANINTPLTGQPAAPPAGGNLERAKMDSEVWMPECDIFVSMEHFLLHAKRIHELVMACVCVCMYVYGQNMKQC